MCSADWMHVLVNRCSGKDFRLTGRKNMRAHTPRSARIIYARAHELDDFRHTVPKTGDLIRAAEVDPRGWGHLPAL